MLSKGKFDKENLGCLYVIIGIAGRIGAGKETLTKFLRDLGFEYFVTSDMISQELVKREIPVTRENQQNLGDELRNKHGPGALMKMLLDKTQSGKNYIFDSLRNAKEAEFLKNNVKDFVLIAVDAPRETRFQRILKRGKPSDPKTWEEFVKVDERDNFDHANPMGQQTGKLIEIADYKIVNANDLETSLKEIQKIWELIKKN